jgi:Homeodomain-like domain
VSSTDDKTITRRQRTTDELLDWRRFQTIKLLAQGRTIDQVADLLQISPKTVQRDHAYIKAYSRELLNHFFTETLPYEVLKAVARLTAVSDDAWSMAEEAKQKEDMRMSKFRQDSLRLAKEAANDIVNIVTNNESLIDSARAAEQREQELEDLEEEEEQQGEGDLNDKIILSENRTEETAEQDPERVF